MLAGHLSPKVEKKNTKYKKVKTINRPRHNQKDNIKTDIK